MYLSNEASVKNYFFARARLHAGAQARVYVAAVVATFIFVSISFAKTKAAAIPTAKPATNLNASKSVDRIEAIENLKVSKAAGAEGQIRARLSVEKDPLVRIRLNQALASVDSPEVVVRLVASLTNDVDPMVRQAAAGSLARYAQDPGAVDGLVLALEDSVPGVKYAAALSLTLSNSPAALSALETASSDTDPNVRKRIAYGLKNKTDKKARQILKRLQSDKDASVKEIARQAD